MKKYNLTQTGQEVQNILDNAIPQSDLASEVERAQEAERLLGEGIQQNADDIDAIEEKIPSAASSENKLTDKEYVDGLVDDEKNRAQDAEQQNADDIDAIEAIIPSNASSENKLADKSFVNSSIATATATFRGTFDMVSDLHLTLDATEQQIATALALAIDTADNNDYCFLQVPTSVDTPTVIGSVDRYKFNGSSWAYEYTLNNSGYTQAQWNAINSGITSGDVTKLEALPTNAQLTTLLNGKQNVLTFDNVPTRNSDNPVKSSGVFNSIEAILALIPSAASVVNQLADKAFVNSSIATATATFRGTYNLVTDLDLTISATYSDIASALADVVSGADNNDYAFVQIPTSDATPTQIAKTVRFKFNGTSWEYEYDLNNSGYTAAQWAAINSGITAALVAKLNGLPTNEALQLALNAITQDIGNLEAVVPTEATSSNQLADKAFVLNEILLATTAFKGQFTTLAQLQAVTGAKTGDMGIVRTKDNDGKDVFTFYQYKDDQWTYFYSLSYHPQDKPATTGIIGSYPFNGMGRVELPMNLVDGWPNDTWLYLPVNGVVYLLYSWNLQLYAVYNSGSQKGLGLENNIVIEPASYNIADIAELVGSRYLSYTEAGGVFTITKPDTTTITSTVLNNTTIYKEDDTDHHGINLLTQSMLNNINTIYVIQYDFVLGEDITVPANCVLEFDGGSVNGTSTLTFQDTELVGTKGGINASLGLAGTIKGMVDIGFWNIKNNDNSYDNGVVINKVASVFKSISIPNYTLYFTTPILMEQMSRIESDATFYYNGRATGISAIKLKQCNGIFNFNKKIDIVTSDNYPNYTENNNSNIIGLEFNSCNESELRFKGIYRFNEGLRVSDTNGNGCCYNTIFVGAIWDANYSIHIYSTSNCWCNENIFIGGNCSHHSNTWDSSWPQYKVRINTSDVCNNTVFEKICLEGRNAIYVSKGQSIVFNSPRFEGCNIALNSNHHLNYIYINNGYLAGKLLLSGAKYRSPSFGNAEVNYNIEYDVPSGKGNIITIPIRPNKTRIKIKGTQAGRFFIRYLSKNGTPISDSERGNYPILGDFYYIGSYQSTYAMSPQMDVIESAVFVLPKGIDEIGVWQENMGKTKLFVGTNPLAVNDDY